MNKNKLVAPKSEKEIQSHWKYTDKVYISCVCITFNHELYIADTLDAMLAQKSDYQFEIIVHDDNSTDKTREIIMKYHKRYPSIIRLILQDENQYSQGKKPINFVLPVCNGEFVAYCEGDDYWTDEKKITIQASYLQKHKNIVITSHDAMVYDSNEQLIKNSKLPNRFKRDFSAYELIKGKAWLLTLNWMFRRIDISDLNEISKVKNGDTFMTSIFGVYGGSHHHEDIKPSVHRHHEGGVWSLLSQIQKDNNNINTFFWLYNYYLRIEQQKYAEIQWKNYISLVLLRVSFKDLTKEYLMRLLFLRKLKTFIRNIIKKHLR